MASRAPAILRQTGPHRIVAGLIVGMALAWRAGHPSIPLRAGAFADETVTAWVGLVAALLLVIAAFGFRLRPTDARRPKTVRIVSRIAGAAAALIAIVVLAVRGSWSGAALAAGFVAVEVVAHGVPVEGVRRVPFEAFALVGEGAIAPLVGYAALAGDPGPPAVLLLTVPNALALALAASLADPTGGRSAQPSLRAVLPGLLHAVLALVASGGALAVVVAGEGLDLRPELALLAVPVAAMAVVFGWLALLDPRPERRERRVGLLVTIAALALAAGVAFVLVVA